MLTGELLHVAVLYFSPGAAVGPHTHDNEQFTFVVEGAMDSQLSGERMKVGERCMLHVPARVAHTLSAPRGATVVIAQDRRGEYAA